MATKTQAKNRIILPEHDVIQVLKVTKDSFDRDTRVMFERQEYIASDYRNQLYVIISQDLYGRVHPRNEILMDLVDKTEIVHPLEWIKYKDECEFTGKLPKRIASYLKKKTNLALSADAQSKIGNLFNEYNLNRGVYQFDFTDRLNWQRGEFGDHGSCFWDDRRYALDIIASNGYAVRFYKNSNGELKGHARAWVAPHFPRQGEITVFNAYGFTLEKVAVILAKYFDAKFTTIELYNFGDADATLYINGAMGAVISKEDDLSKIAGKMFDLEWVGSNGSASSYDEDEYDNEDEDW
jgi:hypothetical protein